MKKFGMLAAIFTFVAAAIGLIVALIYFLDRKGMFGSDEEDAVEVDFAGDEYYAEELAFEAPAEEAPVEEAPAEETAAE